MPSANSMVYSIRTCKQLKAMYLQTNKQTLHHKYMFLCAGNGIRFIKKKIERNSRKE